MRLVAAAWFILVVTGIARANGPASDEGLRLQAAIGFPSILAVGVGYRFATDTEVLASAGAFGSADAGGITSLELVAQQDLARWPGSDLHADLAAARAVAHAPPRDWPDCAGPCESEHQTMWLFGPRLGWRAHPGGAARGARWPGQRIRGSYLDFSGGPVVGRCWGKCRARVYGVALEARLVLAF